MKLWSGPGCTEELGYRKHSFSATGIQMWTKAEGDPPLDVWLSSNRGKVMFTKRAEPAQVHKGDDDLSTKDSLYAAMMKLAKSEFPDAPTEAQAFGNLLKTEHGAQLYSLYDTLGAVEKADTTFEKVAANAALEEAAAAIHQADPSKSPEQCYVLALDAHPELANLAIG